MPQKSPGQQGGSGALARAGSISRDVLPGAWQGSRGLAQGLPALQAPETELQAAAETCGGGSSTGHSSSACLEPLRCWKTVATAAEEKGAAHICFGVRYRA